MKPPKGCRRRVNCNSIFGLVFIVLIYGSKYVNVHLGFQFQVKGSLSWRKFVNCVLVKYCSKVFRLGFYIQFCNSVWDIFFFYQVNKNIENYLVLLFLIRLNFYLTPRRIFFWMFKDHLKSKGFKKALMEPCQDPVV